MWEEVHALCADATPFIEGPDLTQVLAWNQPLTNTERCCDRTKWPDGQSGEKNQESTGGDLEGFGR